MSKTNTPRIIREDMVSACIICREDVSVLLNFQTEENLAYLPSLSAVQSSWRLTVRKLINSIPGLSGKENSVIRVTRFWQPDGAPVCHVIYRVKCLWNEKKVMRLQGRDKWYSLEQVQKMSVSGQLSSPELLEYIGQSLQPNNFYPITTDPEVGKEGFDILNEVLEKQVIIDTETGLTQQEQLLKAAHFSRNEQKRIYKEFWLRTYPHLLMNPIEFEKIMVELGWKKDDWPGLFKCADETSRGGLTFKEFLLFVAATEPETPHGSNTGKIRCDYIFKYFDKNNDNLLEQNELKALVAAIASAKGQSPKDIEKSIVELGLGPKQRLSLNTFVKKVGDLKFRGTSAIFRSKTSILKIVPTLNTSEINNVHPQTPQPNTKKLGFFPIPLHWGEPARLLDESDNTKWDNKPGNKEFEIATHVIKISRAGLIEDVKPVDRMAQGKSISMGHQEYFTRFASMQYYAENNPANELLKALQYFASSSSTPSKSLQKKPLSWGSYNVNQFMALLKTICGKCQEIIEKEPRMLQLSSPVYIMGDLHGNYHDLSVFEKVLWGLGLSLSPCSLLFLGDYVDRGLFGVEVVAYLFAQKVKNPTKVFLLRGNHEIRSIQRNFTFYQECLRKFGEEQFQDIWNTINKVFDVMPLTAVVDTKLFCCHGGIPPPWLCPRIEHINSIPNPLVVPETESLLAWEIMWNDPVKSDQMSGAIYQEMEANEGFALNTTRKTGSFFSIEALDTFLKRNDLSHVIRAHEVRAAGFQVQQGGKLLTVFSSSGYCGGNNEAACIFVSQESKLRILLIDTT